MDFDIKYKKQHPGSKIKDVTCKDRLWNDDGTAKLKL